MSRPIKMTPDTVAELIQKANAGAKGLLLTDYELLCEMNRGRRVSDRICYRTFQRYKATAMAYGEVVVDELDMFDESYVALHDALVYNGIDQKVNIYNQMMEAEGKELQNLKWLMERKFTDMNLRAQTQRAMAQFEILEKRQMEADIAAARGPVERHLEAKRRREYIDEEKRKSTEQQAKAAVMSTPVPTSTAMKPVETSIIATEVFGATTQRQQRLVMWAHTLAKRCMPPAEAQEFPKFCLQKEAAWEVAHGASDNRDPNEPARWASYVDQWNQQQLAWADEMLDEDYEDDEG